MLSIEGKIVDKDKVFRGRIEIDDSGIINKIGEPTGDADFIYKDELIFPGFIDLHVHARECADHSQDYKEDFVSAGEAAISGGVVAFAEMPNNPVPPVDDKSYENKNILAKRSGTPVLLYAGIGKETKPLSKKVPYKVFMGHSIGDLFFTNYQDLERAMERYRGESISFHCEDPKILEENKNKTTHEEQRPKEAEISAVDFALYLIEKYNLNGKICHASTIEAVEKISSARLRGVSVTVEITPHHLFFSAATLALADKDETKILQVNPPIRETKENRLALITALKDGKIDYLATDHAPHLVSEKQKGISGMPELDTYSAFVVWLIKEQGFTPENVARVCSVNPGKFLNQFTVEKYGEIKEGYAGSLTILDTNKPTTISKMNLKTKCGWSPFEGVTFPGEVAMTIVKGKVYAK